MYEGDASMESINTTVATGKRLMIAMDVQEQESQDVVRPKLADSSIIHAIEFR